MIYFSFKPLSTKKQEFVEVPLLDLNTFELYELDTKGLKTIMTGDKAQRFKNRYTVNAINFTDNSKEFVSNMKADYGVYKDNRVDLKSNIAYVREDGLSFESDTMHYNTKTGIVKTEDSYLAHKGESTMEGKGLEYNSKLQTLNSNKVIIKYNLEEGK